MTRTYKHPSTLAFTRSIEPGIFAFFATNSQDPKALCQPVLVTSESLRATISNYMDSAALEEHLSKSVDEKSEKNPRNANLQSVEKATLPIGYDTLSVHGHISFLANTGHSCMSNDPNFMAVYQLYHQLFTELNGWQILAERYVMNMVNGRWLWRNRSQVAQAEDGALNVTLRYQPAQSENQVVLKIDALTIPAKQSLQLAAISDENLRAQIARLCDHIAQALSASGEEAWKQGLRISLSAEAVIGEGASVYPSQEFATNADKISKVLAKRGIGEGKYQAIFHEQKVGNAIRTVDTWYDHDIGDARAIAAEPYGVVTTESAIYRDGKRARHFYQIIGRLDEELERLQQSRELTGDDYFFMSVIVRGGVLGGEGKKDKKVNKEA